MAYATQNREDSSFWQRRQIDNPLRHYTLDELDQATKEFAAAIGAEGKLFVKAGRLARDPPAWSTIDGLTDEETDALGEEKERGFFRQPKMLRTTIVALVFSAISHGWIQSVSNGANQTLPEYFGLKRRCGNHSWNGTSAIWKFAGINSITYLMAAIFGCWISDPLQSRFLGRRGAILVSACICLMGTIGAACATSWWEEMIWRAIIGIGLGAKAAVTSVFGAEVAPSHLRGQLVMNWQLFVAFGIFCGFTANLVFYWTKDLAWRFQIASACIAEGVLLALIPTVHESPRWLLKKGRVKDAYAALCALRHTPLQAAAELFYAHAQIQMEIEFMHEHPATDFEMQTKGIDGIHQPVNNLTNLQYYRNAVASTNYWSRILQLFRDPRTRRATVASSVVMLGQQLCGVNVLAFYSTVFFRDINRYRSKSLDALWLSWGLGLANFLFTFPAYFGIERLGRRSLLLMTYPGMIISMFGASMSFLSGTTGEQSVRAGVFMFFFILFYSLGQGPVAFAYSSEVFPLFNREVGMSWAVFVNLLGAGLLTLFVPLFQVASTTHPGDASLPSEDDSDKCTEPPSLDVANIVVDAMQGEMDWGVRQAKLLGAFVGFGFLSFLLIFFFVPETKLAAAGKKSRRAINYISLEELNHIFKMRTRDFIRYQFLEVLPYEFEILKYLIGRRKDMPTLPVPWIWAQDDDDDASSSSNPRQTRTGSDLNRIQQEYNPGANDRRNNPQQPQYAHQDRLRAVGNSDDDLRLPEPPFHRERAGSIDWDPSEHPSTDVSAPTSQIDFGRDASEIPGRPSTSSVSSVRVDRRMLPDDHVVRRGEAEHTDESNRAAGSDDAEGSRALSEQQTPPIRRKPVPMRSGVGGQDEADGRSDEHGNDTQYWEADQI